MIVASKQELIKYNHHDTEKFQQLIKLIHSFLLRKNTILRVLKRKTIISKNAQNHPVTFGSKVSDSQKELWNFFRFVDLKNLQPT